MEQDVLDAGLADCIQAAEAGTGVPNDVVEAVITALPRLMERKLTAAQAKLLAAELLGKDFEVDSKQP